MGIRRGVVALNGWLTDSHRDEMGKESSQKQERDSHINLGSINVASVGSKIAGLEARIIEISEEGTPTI